MITKHRAVSGHFGVVGEMSTSRIDLFIRIFINNSINFMIACYFTCNFVQPHSLSVLCHVISIIFQVVFVHALVPVDSGFHNDGYSAWLRMN